MERSCIGVSWYYVTSLLVVISVCASKWLVPSPPEYIPQEIDTVWRFARWDGCWYFQICEIGYDYLPGEASTVAFFPAYPILAKAAAGLLGLSTIWGLVLISHVCLAAAFCTFASYVASRNPELGEGHVHRCLLAFGLLPTTFFFRMTYSESVLLLFASLSMLAIIRRAPLWVIALLVGAATGSRPVGVALVPVLGLCAWRRFRDRDSGQSCRGLRLAGRTTITVVLGCWGILGYAAYLWSEYGDPLVFAKAQGGWRIRLGDDIPMAQKAWATATGEPIRSVYQQSDWGHWQQYDRELSFALSLQFANPVYFMGTAVLIAIGWWKGWLIDYELLLSAGLLLIPYVTKSYDNAMSSFGRFSAVVLPAYIVVARLLGFGPRWLVALAMSLSAVVLAIYSALFAAGHAFI